MDSKKEHDKSVYKEMIVVEVAAEKIAGTDEASSDYLSNIQSRLEKNEEFDGSKYNTKNGDTLIITTKEGYKYVVIGDKVILADDDTGDTKIPEVNEGDVRFKTIPNYWVNTSVTLEISCPKHPLWDIEYSEDTTNWTEYNGKITVDSNKTIYVRLRNSIGASETYATHSIINIDKTAPRLVAQSFKSSNVTTRGFTVGLETQDNESGLSQIVWNYKLKKDTNWNKSVTDVYHKIHASTSGETGLVSKTHKFDKLPGGTYMIQASIYDVAGNITVTDPIEITVGKIDDIVDVNDGTTSYSPKTWTNESVTVHLPTVPNLETRYTTSGRAPTISSDKYNTSTPIVVTENTNIYYIYTDGINISKCATKSITNIDKQAPLILGSVYLSDIKVRAFTLNVEIQDSPSVNASGISEVVWHYRQKGESTWISESEIYQSRPSEQAGIRGKVTKSKDFRDFKTGTYEAFVDVYDVAGNKATSRVEEFNLGITEEVGNATYNPTYWTNEEVTVTLPVAPEGLMTVFTRDGSVPTKNSEEYKGPFKVSSNCTINYVYTDGLNINTAKTLNVTNIEKKKPDITLALRESNITTNGFTLSASVRDTDVPVEQASGLCKVVFYYRKSGDAQWVTETEEYKAMHSTTNGPRTIESPSKTASGLPSGTYEAYIEVYDVAGNVTSTAENPISFNLGKIVDVGNSTYAPTYWTNGEVTVTLPTAPTGLKTVFTRNGSVPNSKSEEYKGPFKVSSNCTINYVYTDGININTAKTLNVTNIETKKPDIIIPLAQRDITTSGFTLHVGVQDTDVPEAKASGLSKVVFYYKKTTATNWMNQTENYTEMHSITNGPRTMEAPSKTVSGLPSGTYEAYVEVYDVAGDRKSVV